MLRKFPRGKIVSLLIYFLAVIRYVKLGIYPKGFKN